MGCSSSTLPRHDPFEKKRIEYKNSERDALDLVNITEKSDNKITADLIANYDKLRKLKPIIESQFKNLETEYIEEEKNGTLGDAAKTKQKLMNESKISYQKVIQRLDDCLKKQDNALNSMAIKN